ncbi:MAG: class C sortase [Mogibacterium sp.]|nr:class C sortase [Mogibacterium sp.]
MRLRLDKRTLAFIFIFLIGLSILLYPLVSSTWNQHIANMVMSDYDDSVAEVPKDTLKDVIAAAREYNAKLLPKAVPDAFAVRENTSDVEYESLLNVFGNGMMGYIEIPVLRTKSPIYHYTTEEALQKGVGHLFGSSLPVGGKGTHAVLSAHRGLPSNRLFSDLDKIKVGDKFFITVCDETIAYQVDQIEIVLPDETDSLALVEGKDYVTLVTCTPYGVNTHRILVRGYRVPYKPGEEENVKARAWLNMNIMMGLVGALLGILIALILVIRLKRRDDDEEIEQDEDDGKEKKTIHIR